MTPDVAIHLEEEKAIKLCKQGESMKNCSRIDYYKLAEEHLEITNKLKEAKKEYDEIIKEITDADSD